jgi:hypothetical protein
MPSAVTPDAILEYSPTASRVLKVDANVIAYFGDYFHAFRQGLIAAPASSVRIDPANTASAQNPS